MQWTGLAAMSHAVHDMFYRSTAEDKIAKRIIQSPLSGYNPHPMPTNKWKQYHAKFHIQQ
jgi:hypothetical protein